MTTTSRRHTSTWRQVNISPAERAGRVLLGLAAIVAGVTMLTNSPAVWAIIVELLLIAAGLDLLITGAVGHCPLYQKLGHLPKSLRRQP